MGCAAPPMRRIAGRTSLPSASTALRGSRCRVETAHVSPDKRHLAICSEVRTLLGLRVHQAGMLYSVEDGSIVGRIAIGKRTAKGWVEAAYRHRRSGAHMAIRPPVPLDRLKQFPRMTSWFNPGLLLRCLAKSLFPMSSASTPIED